MRTFLSWLTPTLPSITAAIPGSTLNGTIVGSHNDTILRSPGGSKDGKATISSSGAYDAMRGTRLAVPPTTSIPCIRVYNLRGSSSTNPSGSYPVANVTIWCARRVPASPAPMISTLFASPSELLVRRRRAWNKTRYPNQIPPIE